MKTLRRHKYAILLAALVCVVFIQSFAHRRVLGSVASDLVVTTSMLLVFLIIFDRLVHRLVAFIAAVTAVAIDWAHYVMLPSPHQALLAVAYHGALLLLFGFATFLILRNVFEQRVVRTDDVLGAVCGYLLAAGAWSSLYVLIETFMPGSFTVAPGFEAGLDSWHGRTAVLNYVSLGALTSVGSGGVVPVLPPATVLTALEAVFGQFYIAVVVAQLVSTRLSHARQQSDSSQS